MIVFRLLPHSRNSKIFYLGLLYSVTPDVIAELCLKFMYPAAECCYYRGFTLCRERITLLALPDSLYELWLQSERAYL
jgi:hypothetical protein